VVVKAISLARARERSVSRETIDGADQKITASRVGTVDYIYEPRINKSDYGLYGLRMRR